MNEDQWNQEMKVIERMMVLVDLSLKLENCSPEMRLRVRNRVLTGHPDGVEPPSIYARVTQP